MDPSDSSLWEYGAKVQGWNEANNPEDTGADLPPAMSADEYENLLREVG